MRVVIPSISEGPGGREVHERWPGRSTASIDGSNLAARRARASYLIDRDAAIYQTSTIGGWITWGWKGLAAPARHAIEMPRVPLRLSRGG